MIRLDAARYEPFLWQESIELKEDEKRDLELLEASPVRCQGSLTFTAPDFLLHAEHTETGKCQKHRSQQYVFSHVLPSRAAGN